MTGESEAARPLEVALRESEARHRFLAEFAAETQAHDDANAIVATAARLLADYLQVDRCAYAVVEDEAIFNIHGDYSRGVPSIVGRWPVSAFGQACVTAMRANEPFVVMDVARDGRLAAEDRPAYAATNIEAVICLPLHKSGKFTAAMAVHQKSPRDWRPHEIALVQTVVERCWEALERARVHHTLRESEARYRAIVDATPACVKLVAADGTVLQMNSSGLAMVEGDESIFGRSIYSVIAPEDRERFRAFNEQVCGGVGGTLQYDIVGLKGTRRHLETSAVPLATADRAFTHLAVTRDISPQVTADRTLAEARARADYAVQAAGLGFWYCDLPFDELNWDWRVKAHFWLPPDARVTITTFFDRIHPDDRELTQQAIEASMRDHANYAVEYRTVDPASGGVKWIRALGGTAYGAAGEPIRFDGVTVDITARKLEEERLEKILAREREQSRLLKHVADAALRINSAGTLDSVILVAAEEARDIIRAHIAVTELLATEHHPQVSATSMSAEYRAAGKLADLARDLELTAIVRETNLPVRIAATERQLSRLAAPLISRSGRNLGLLSLADKFEGDFTETDEFILEQLAHLASVAIENARLYSEVREQDRRKDEFLAILAHELRNPLAPLRNGLQVLRMTAADPELDSIRTMMDRQLTHMVRLIDDLLDVSRISRSKMELRQTRVTLADVIRSAVETVRLAIDEAGHALEIALPTEPVYLYADLTRLAQVFGNLLSNSAKYTPRGGRICVSSELKGAMVAVRVEDNGIGIPGESLPRIFDMFSQVDRSIERSTGGMGIGLALVKGLVEMHHGSVEATSAGAGQGCVFTVRLPRMESAVQTTQQQQPQAGAIASGAGEKILVVDDNRDSAASLAMMLKLLGNEVRTAFDGLEAVELAAEFRPAVIFMDIGMPRLNGYEAARRIREQPWGAAVTIVALTGWGQQSDRLRSKQAGCDEHLVKPVNPTELEALLQRRRS